MAWHHIKHPAIPEVYNVDLMISLVVGSLSHRFIILSKNYVKEQNVFTTMLSECYWCCVDNKNGKYLSRNILMAKGHTRNFMTENISIHDDDEDFFFEGHRTQWKDVEIK